MKILITTDWYVPVINGVVTSVLLLKREEARRAAKEVKTPDVIPMPGATEDSSAGNSEIPPEGKPRSDGELPH